MNTITTVGLTLLLIGVGTMWNLRSFISTEITPRSCPRLTTPRGTTAEHGSQSELSKNHQVIDNTYRAIGDSG